MAHYKTWSASRGNRLPREHYACGTPVHVTICTDSREPLFLERQLALAVFQRFAAERKTLALCLMPDHLHWLLPCSRHDLDLVGTYKSLSTRDGWRYGVSGKIWQRSYWDSVVRKEQDLFDVARYLVANPVRAGLVDDVESYGYQFVFEDRIQEAIRSGAV